MPGGASFGAKRASAALKEPLRSEPQITVTFTGSVMTIHASETSATPARIWHASKPLV